MNKINVIFRTCDTVNSVHQTPRPFGLDKKTLIKISFISLVESIKDFEHEIFVIGDKLSDEMISFFSSFHVNLTLGNYGNDESIRQTLILAKGLPEDEWVYFCEDDYVHRPETFTYIVELIENRKEYLSYLPGRKLLRFLIGDLASIPLVIHPTDYPDRYLKTHRKQSFIFVSKYCHWRQISNTTFTFLTEAKTVKNYYKVFLEASNGANDGVLSKKIFGRLNFINKALCVSPMPSLTAHMHNTTLSPLVDWEKICRDIKLNL